MSTRSPRRRGTSSPRWFGLPAGHDQDSTFPNRVEPTTRSPARATTANGNACPAVCAVSASSTQRLMAASVAATVV